MELEPDELSAAVALLHHGVYDPGRVARRCCRQGGLCCRHDACMLRSMLLRTRDSRGTG